MFKSAFCVCPILQVPLLRPMTPQDCLLDTLMCKLLRTADMVRALGGTRKLTSLPSTGVHSVGQEGCARARAEAPPNRRGRTH